MITTLFTTLSLWLHTLATIVMVGHYLLLALAYLPALKRALDADSLPGVLAGMAAGIRAWMLIALAVFAVTGFYLMLVNESYRGLGQFGNAWSLLMLAKHLLVFVMIGLGFQLNRMPGAGGTWLASFTSRLVATSICGLLVLLLTALAQAQ